MNRQQLIDIIKQKESFLCIGLDPDLERIPKHILKFEDPIFEFNKHIIDATIEYAVAYKPNTAFYESLGSKGWVSLEKTIEYLNSFSDQVFTIADAKRGDIGNTSRMYAKSFFEAMNFDAITVAPYMGEDSVKPFLEADGWVILLALTSNQGAFDFQFINPKENGLANHLFEEVILKSQKWGTTDNLMYVIGATKANQLQNIREIAPEHFLLVPGVGAQGGSLEEVAKYGMNSDCGLLVNSSRGIIFASDDYYFSDKAAQKAKAVQKQMSELLKQYKVL